MSTYLSLWRIILPSITANARYVLKSGETPLLKAVKEGSFEMMHFLIDNGADVNIVDEVRSSFYSL